ncbi:thiamine-phosphate kinase [Aquiluna sp.]|nr:thiamine-phosphate kinase [Aquiluna sp.]MDA7799074.1 thiamine-phosphate kinase [Aquiluna sp.]
MEYIGETIIEIGESEALSRALSFFKSADSTLLGSGDDAAVVSLSDPRVVITTDTMVENHDFRTDWSSGFDLGFKAVTTNVADLVAMGATPRALTVALVVSKQTKQAWLEDFARGLQAACDQYTPRVEVVGGDLASGSEIVIAVTAHGDLADASPVLRSTAKPGDLVVVAGTLGKAAAGLALLNFDDPTAAASYEELVAIQLRPSPDVVLGLEISKTATAMMDISDGLSLDARRLAKQSGVSIELEKRLLEGYAAVLEQASQSINSRAGSQLVNEWDWVLHGGEDHSFLVTLPSGAPLPRGAKVIGTVVLQRDHAVYLDADPLQAKGWDSVRG